MKTTGNTMLITGGGSGIGRGLAEAFHQQGNRVVISGRRREVLEETAKANPGMECLTADMNSAEDIERFAKELAEKFPALNVVVHNAGIMSEEKVQELGKTLPQAEAMVTTNLLGPIRLTAALMPLLLGQASATLVTVTSGLAFMPLALNPTYCATKAAIHAWTESLRYQLAGTHIEVVELVPPYVQTELQGARQKNDPNAMPLPDFIAESVKLMAQEPTPCEIQVERVKFLRTAPTSGEYEERFKKFNDMMTAARS